MVMIEEVMTDFNVNLLCYFTWSFSVILSCWRHKGIILGAILSKTEIQTYIDSQSSLLGLYL